jgi:Kef-type K+ transport system membrane component KefB
MMGVRHAGGTGATELPGTALALGFALVMALVIGEVFRRLRLPRLTGYLLFGLLIGPYLGNVITESMARQLQLITGLSTTVIAFIAGLSLNVERLGRRVSGFGRLTVVTLGVAIAGPSRLPGRHGRGSRSRRMRPARRSSRWSRCSR